jgi:hypothetical protein
MKEGAQVNPSKNECRIAFPPMLVRLTTLYVKVKNRVVR